MIQFIIKMTSQINLTDFDQPYLTLSLHVRISNHRMELFELKSKNKNQFMYFWYLERPLFVL